MRNPRDRTKMSRRQISQMASPLIIIEVCWITQCKRGGDPRVPSDGQNVRFAGNLDDLVLIPTSCVVGNCPAGTICSISDSAIGSPGYLKGSVDSSHAYDPARWVGSLSLQLQGEGSARGTQRGRSGRDVAAGWHRWRRSPSLPDWVAIPPADGCGMAMQIPTPCSTSGRVGIARRR